MIGPFRLVAHALVWNDVCEQGESTCHLNENLNLHLLCEWRRESGRRWFVRMGIMQSNRVFVTTKNRQRWNKLAHGVGTVRGRSVIELEIGGMQLR